MERIWCVFWAIPALTIAITVSSNGNSPEIKMIGGMMVDTEKGFVPMEPKQQQENAITEKSNYEKSRALKLNNTKLSINERYRRLIPYMTFYYANDLSTPTTESYSTKDVQVEKLHLIEAPQSERSPRIIPQQSYHNVPRYHGNRLTKYNIASSNPGRLFKDSFPPHYIQKTPIYNIDGKYLNQYNNNRYVQKIKTKPEISYPTYQTRKPYLNLFQSDDNANLRYYLLNKEPVQQYKLIPYEQTPPVKVEPESVVRYENFQKPTFVKESVYTKPRPQHNFDTLYYKSPRKQPVTISENYFEKVPSSGQSLKVQPFLETGFKPIISDHVTQTTAIPVYMSTVTESPHMYYEGRKQVSLTETSSVSPDNTNTILRPAYYQYVVDQPVRQQVHPEYVSNAATLSDLFNSLQDTKSIPKPITRDNVGASIKTLLQVLNALRVAPLENEVVDAPVLSTPKPFLVTPKILEIPSKPVVEPVTDDVELSQEPYLAPVTPPSQHLDDFHYGRGSTQTFPLQVNSDDEGGTPGKPGVDYPILTTIPETSFDCKTQRYKGFFADPETKCQVWHYCDLNGGQASFLCPNGTIFSQAALTCDWWFNVRCASTTQLYVLNESLYKYILPHSPKFPEDYSGPLVDKYLTLKFKEMEEQFKKNKNKQAAEDKMDSSEEKDSGKVNTESTDNVELGSSEKSYLSEPNIVVETPGTSGNVERISE